MVLKTGAFRGMKKRVTCNIGDLFRNVSFSTLKWEGVWGRIVQGGDENIKPEVRGANLQILSTGIGTDKRMRAGPA